MPNRRRVTQLSSAVITALSLVPMAYANGWDTPHETNPISKLARMFDADLVRTEDRVMWLDSRLSTFAQHREHAMKVGIGYRGYRKNKDAPDPSVTLDLGREYPLDKVFLVPSQREFAEDTGIFPRRFTLEISKTADFSQKMVIHTTPSGTRTPLATDGNPVPFPAHGVARYVRLTVHEGHNKGMLDLFGLSEIAVFSNRDPVSFGASVATYGDLNAPGIWYPEALVDGRTQLGVWQNGGYASGQLGDAVTVARRSEPVSWTIKLEKSAEVDRIVLFPYQLDRSFESSVFPDELTVELQNGDGSWGEVAFEWRNPLPSSGSMTPLVIPLKGKSASAVRLTGTRPCTMGDLKVHAISEIEVWSAGVNVAKDLSVTRTYPGGEAQVTTLTDGFASEKQIIPFSAWLEQLYERGRTERELAQLRPVHRQKTAETEHNVMWGSAVLLGLTFLIPVLIVERRRLLSREQLDQLRKRIASDLHDDIGSNLGSISLIARTARKDLERMHGPEELATDLGEVESIARESSLAMRDIVWLLECRQDSIGDLVQRMRETAGRLLREIDYTLECDSSKTTSKLSLDAKRHLFLFYKEAIHNVLKHSQANQVSIRLWDEDDKLALEILDNGIGLPTDANSNHTGVHKLEDRARVLDGLLQIASSKETGTKIRLLVKRSHLTAHPSLA